MYLAFGIGLMVGLEISFLVFEIFLTYRLVSCFVDTSVIVGDKFVMKLYSKVQRVRAY